MSYTEEITVCCFGFCPVRAWTPLEIERSFDDNDHDILFKNNNSNGEQLFSNECIDFWCHSYPLGNNCILLKKVNYEKKISLVLTIKDENDKRVLIDGCLIVDGKKYDVTDFKTYEVLKIGENTYENIAACNYNA